MPDREQNFVSTPRRSLHTETFILICIVMVAGSRQQGEAFTLSNGVYIDTFVNHRLANVEVAGFLIKNAVNEGILIANTSFVTIRDNRLFGNNSGLTSGCPGLPSTKPTNRLTAAKGFTFPPRHSTIAKNIVTKNAGGILVGDDTGPTHDNLASDNTAATIPSTAHHARFAPFDRIRGGSWRRLRECDRQKHSRK